MNTEELKSLAQVREGPCVSIFLPTHRMGKETEQDPIRLKNLVVEAEDRLTEMGMSASNAKDMLSPAAKLLEDDEFWRYQGNGLAIFLSPEFFKLYRLPLVLDELLAVTGRFHLKPLVPLLTQDGRFFVLALSQNSVRLIECTRFSANEINLENTSIPPDIETALEYDDPEKQQQFHTNAPSSGSAGGRWSAAFHGQGVVDDVKDDLKRYFQQIDSGMWELLKDERVPLVLYGVDYLLPIYGEVNSYSHLMNEGVTGNPDELRAEELQEQAWAVIEPRFIKAREDAIERYRQMLADGLASDTLQEVVAASYFGRVDTLFVAVGIQVWGSSDPDTGTVEVHVRAQPGDEDLLDFAAANTLLNGGTVFALEPEEMPNETTLAAVFRY